MCNFDSKFQLDWYCFGEWYIFIYIYYIFPIRYINPTFIYYIFPICIYIYVYITFALRLGFLENTKIGEIQYFCHGNEC